MIADRPTNGVTRALLAAGIAGPILFVAVFTVEGALRADYDAMRHQVSLLSLSGDGWTQVVSFLVCGGLIVAFAVGLRSVLAHGRAAVGGPIAVGCVGAGMITAGLFSVQPSFGYPPGAPPGIGSDISVASYLHVLGAMFFVFGMAVACFVFAARFRAEGRRGWAFFSLVSGIVVVVFFAASSGGPDGLPLFPDYAGLLQRISIVTGMAWSAVLAAAILTGAIESTAPGGLD